MSYLSPYADELEADSEHNYLVRHWRGYLPLPVSYWVNGGILFAATGFLGGLVILAIGGTSSLQAVAVATVSVILLLAVMRVWSLVGIWRSAGRHVARGGSAFWAGVAQIMVVLGAIGSLAQISNVALQLNEFGQLALGSDPIGEPAKLSVSADGRDLLVEGYLTEGDGSRFRQLASGAEAVERVVLSSPGGRILEGELFAAVVQERGLATHVRDQCFSACTIVLLAGEARTAELESQIGFHRASFPGLSPDEDRMMNAQMMRLYRRANLPSYFLQRIDSTGSDDMWIPTAAELMDAEVLTDAEPQLQAALLMTARNAGANLPRRIDEITTLQRATAGDDSLTFQYRLDLPASAVDRSQFEAEMDRALRIEVCRDQGAAELMTLGGQFVYAYSARNGASVAEITISYCDGPNRFRATRAQAS